VVAGMGMVLPQQLDSYGAYLDQAANPWAIEALVPVADGVAGEIADIVSIGAMVVLTVLVLVDLGVRWRRSTGVERIQMRWFGLGVAVMLALLVAGAVLFRLDHRLDPAFEIATVVLAINATPVAVGVAAARYRLYDIDRLVSRTVAYGVATAVLAATYGGVVVALGPVLGRGSDLAVAAATLAAAAVFQPARRRVQATVDRRFDRARYDARRTLDAFAHRLRDEVRAEQLTRDLVGVTSAALQPARASVWLRGEQR
jgi:hypothetical protein